MDPNPIVRVLSVFLNHQVKALLIGGQACIFYRAAEFSRDVDYAIEQIRFWLMECRTPDLLITLRKRFPTQARALSIHRPLLSQALPGNEQALYTLLKQEEERERKLDEEYWAPLRKELEHWRRKSPA